MFRPEAGLEVDQLTLPGQHPLPFLLGDCRPRTKWRLGQGVGMASGQEEAEEVIFRDLLS